MQQSPRAHALSEVGLSKTSNTQACSLVPQAQPAQSPLSSNSPLSKRIFVEDSDNSQFFQKLQEIDLF